MKLTLSCYITLLLSQFTVAIYNSFAENCCFPRRMRWQSGNTGGKGWPTSWQSWPVYTCTECTASGLSQHPPSEPLGPGAGLGELWDSPSDEGHNSWLHFDIMLKGSSHSTTIELWYPQENMQHQKYSLVNASGLVKVKWCFLFLNHKPKSNFR